MFFYFIAFLAGICSGGEAIDNKHDAATDSGSSDSIKQYIYLPQYYDTGDTVLNKRPVHNPVLAGAFALLLPGAGHIYLSTGEVSYDWRRSQIIRGGLYLAAQGIAAGVMAHRVNNYFYLSGIYDDSAATRQKFANEADAAVDTAYKSAVMSSYYKTGMNCEVSRYNRRAARYNMYQAIGWNIGLYLFNSTSAVYYSGVFDNDKPENPVKAGWLSAVPALGLGQIYNGSVAKAGMIWMTETMLLYMAYNNNRLIDDCIKQRELIADTTGWRYAFRINGSVNYSEVWETEYKQAFRFRNMYLWYGIFFYFYGIFDAVVDAHLHDFDQKIRMEPVLEPSGSKVGFSFNGEF
jgi:hypothetical protein